MRLLMVRHGYKQYIAGHEEPEWPLSQQARLDAQRLSAQLATAGFEVGVCLTSSWRHAHETAEILAGTNGPLPEDVTGLTPKTDDKFFSLEAILKEADERGIDVAALHALTMVGHDPRLNQLCIRMTSTPIADWARLEVVVVEAVSVDALLRGAARVIARVKPDSVHPFAQG